MTRSFQVLYIFLILCMGGHPFCAANEIQNLKQRIDKEEKALNQLMNKISSGQKRLQELNVQQTKARIRILDNQAEYKQLSKRVKDTEGQLLKTRKEMSKTKAAMESATRQFTKYQGSFYNRLSYLYRHRNLPFLKLLLSSQSLSQFSNRLYYYAKIVESDSGQFQDLMHQGQVIDSKRRETERQKESLSTLGRKLVAERGALLSKIQSDKDYLTKIGKEQEGLRKRASKMDKSSQYLKDRIQNLISAREQMEDDLGSKHRTDLMKRRKTIAKGSLLWPIKGSYKIARKFGNLNNGSASIFSPGLDLEPPEPKSIYASEDGIVFYKGYPAGNSSTYGKVVMIAHGDYDGKFITLYGNLSTILVALNQTVKRGDRIATVSTNTPRGEYQKPRLHYQVRVDGEPTNPLHWLEKI